MLTGMIEIRGLPRLDLWAVLFYRLAEAMAEKYPNSSELLESIGRELDLELKARQLFWFAPRESLDLIQPELLNLSLVEVEAMRSYFEDAERDFEYSPTIAAFFGSLRHSTGEILNTKLDGPTNIDILNS